MPQLLLSDLHPFTTDMGALAVSLLVLLTYYLFLRWRLKRDPVYTVQAVNAIARTAWVQNVMGSPGKDILAVQTLRNSIMGPTFLASTAVLLIMGTLTLSGQGENLSATWHSVNLFGSTDPRLWTLKLVAILVDFFVAFFSFSLAIRLFIHVGFMINVPVNLQHRAITPAHVAMLLNRAGSHHTMGMRAYYTSVPLVLWLFGPLLMLAASIVLVIALHQIDRAPKVLADDYR